MTKKLQVFISSTYTDLRAERQAAVEAVLLSRQIPAGMELFSAGDASQLEVIKDWIRESDVYMLVLGARYGSLEPSSNVGYTEIEYDFAVGLGKPHFALVLKDSAVQRKRSEGLISAEDDCSSERLNLFRKKVLSKTSVFCDDGKDIKIAVLQSLNEISRRPNLQGWIRPSEQPSLGPVLERVEALSAENEMLRANLQGAKKSGQPELADLSDTFAFSVEYRSKGYSTWHPRKYTMTWKDLFSRMGIKLLAPQNDEVFNHRLAREIGAPFIDAAEDVVIAEPSWETIKAQFLALGFVKVEYLQTISKTMALFWSLTPLGQQVTLALRAVPAKAVIG